MPQDTQISRFRAAHPQYDEYSDDDVIEAVRQTKAPDASIADWKEAFMQTYGDPKSEPGLVSTMTSGFAAGVGDVAASMGGAYDYVAGSNEKNPVTKWGEKIEQENQPPPEARTSVLDDPSVLLKWQWWAHNVPRLLPFTAISLIPGAGGYKLASAGAKALSFAENAAHIAGVAGAAGAGGLFESLGEAGSTYNQMIDAGKSKDEASKAANDVLGKNIVLNSLINAIEVGKIFKAKGIIPTEELVRKTAKEMMSDIGVTVGAEAIQESLQQVISNTATGQNWYDGLAESAILGGVGGGFYGGGLDIIYNMGKPVRERLEARLQSEQRPLAGADVNQPMTPFDEKLAKAVKQANKDVELMKEQVRTIQNPEVLDNLIESWENAIIRSDPDKSRAQEVLTSLANWYGGDKQRYAESLAEAIGGYLIEQQQTKKANKSKNEKLPKAPVEKIHKDAGIGVVKDAATLEKEAFPNRDLPPQDIVPENLRSNVVYQGTQNGGKLQAFVYRDGSGSPKDGANFSYIEGEGNFQTAYDDFNKRYAPTGYAKTAATFQKLTREEFTKLTPQQKRKALQEAFGVTNEQFKAFDAGLVKAVAKTRGVTPEELVYNDLVGINIEQQEGTDILAQQLWKNRDDLLPIYGDQALHNPDIVRNIDLAHQFITSKYPMIASIADGIIVQTPEWFALNGKAKGTSAFYLPSDNHIYINSDMTIGRRDVPELVSDIMHELVHALRVEKYGKSKFFELYKSAIEATKKNDYVGYLKNQEEVLARWGGSLAENRVIREWIGDQYIPLGRPRPEDVLGQEKIPSIDDFLNAPKAIKFNGKVYPYTEDAKAFARNRINEFGETTPMQHHLDIAFTVPKIVEAAKEQFGKSWEGAIINEEFKGIDRGFLVKGQYLSESAVEDIVKAIKRRLNLFQGKESDSRRAAIELLGDGSYILHAYQGADFSSLVHEVIGHLVAKRWMTPEETMLLEKHYGKPVEQWTNEAEWENIAKTFEKYVQTGAAPTVELQPIFEKIKQFMLEIYKNIKDYFQGITLDNNITKVFDSWLDKESKTSLERQIRSELVRGVPLDNKRVVGSIEGLDRASFTTISDQLQRIGYQSVAIPTADGKTELMYYVDPTDKVQRAIGLRARELGNDDLSVRDKMNLGFAYGYSKSAVENYAAQLKEEKEKVQYITGENLYSQESKFGGGKNYWEMTNTTPDGKVTMRLIQGPLVEQAGGNLPDLTLTPEQFEKANFIKEEKILRGGKAPSGKSAKVQGERTTPNVQDELVKAAMAANEAGVSPEVAAGIGEEVARGTTTTELIDTETEITDESSGERIDLVGDAAKKSIMFSLEQQLDEITEKFDWPEYQNDGPERQKLVDEFNKISQKLREASGEIALRAGLSSQERRDMYDELGLTKLEGDRLSDAQLEKMIQNRSAGMVDGELLGQATVTPFRDDQVVVEVGEIGRGVWENFTPEGVKAKVLDFGLNPEELRITRDKIYMKLGMAQTLARYNPEFFGQVFWAVDDGLKIASELDIKSIQQADYLGIKRMSKESIKNIVRALQDGTLARTEEEIAKPTPPWLEWQSMRTLRMTMTDEQLTAERERRQQVRAAYKEQLGQYKESLATNYRNRGREWTNQELIQRYNMNEDEIRAYRTIRSIANTTTEYNKLASVARGMPKELADLTYSLRGYVPLERGSGKWGFFFKDPTAPQGYGYTRFRTRLEAEQAFNQLFDKGLVNNNDDRYKIRRVIETPRQYYQYFGVSQLVQLLDESGVKGKTREKILKEYRKKQYSTARLIPRGYVGVLLDPQTFFDTFEEWVERSHKRYSKAITNQRVDSILSLNRSKAGDDRLANAWKNFAQEYVQLAYSPGNLSSSFWDNIRRAGFLWALSFNVSNAILNSTQPLVTVLPELASKEWGLSNKAINTIFMRSAAMGMDIGFRGKLSNRAIQDIPGLGEAFEKWKAQSVISASLYEQLVNVFGATNKALHTTGILQSTTEKMNRGLAATAGYLAAYEHLIDKAVGNQTLAARLTDIASLDESQLREVSENFTPDKQPQEYTRRIQDLQDRILRGNLSENEKQYIAMRFGRYMSDTTNFIYGKHALPRLIQSAGILANPLRSGFLFKGFLLNYVGFLGTALQKGRISPKSFSYALLPLIALAGISGLPFADDMKDALKKLGVTDIDTELRRMIGDNTLSDLIIKGIPSILPGKIAFDMSRRAGAGQVLPQGLARGDVPSAVQDFFIGAPGSMLTRAADGIKDIVAGDYTLGYQKATPIFISNLIKATRYADEGAVTSRGDLLVPPSELRGTPQLVGGLGFTPEKVAAAQDLNLAIQYLTQGRRDAVQKFNLKLANAIRKGDRGAVKDVIEEIMQYNANVDNPGDRYILANQLRSVRKRVLVGTNPMADIPANVPTGLRGEAVKLTQLYSK